MPATVRERMRGLIAEDPEAPPLEVLRWLREEGHLLGESTFYRSLRAGREGLPTKQMGRFEEMAGDPAAPFHLTAGMGLTPRRPRYPCLEHVEGRGGGAGAGDGRRVGRTGESSLRDLGTALVAVYATDDGVCGLARISGYADATRQAASYRAGRVPPAGGRPYTHLVRRAIRARTPACRMR